MRFTKQGSTCVFSVIIGIITSPLLILVLIDEPSMFHFILVAFLLLGTLGCIYIILTAKKEFYQRCYANGIYKITDNPKILEYAENTLIRIPKEESEQYAYLEKAYLQGRGQKSSIDPELSSKIFAIIFVIVIGIFYFMFIYDSGPKWSDLSDKEKANAEFAYEIKQYQKEYEKNNKKK